MENLGPVRDRSGTGPVRNVYFGFWTATKTIGMMILHPKVNNSIIDPSWVTEHLGWSKSFLFCRFWISSNFGTGPKISSRPGLTPECSNIIVDPKSTLEWSNVTADTFWRVRTVQKEANPKSAFFWSKKMHFCRVVWGRPLKLFRLGVTVPWVFWI